MSPVAGSQLRGKYPMVNVEPSPIRRRKERCKSICVRAISPSQPARKLLLCPPKQTRSAVQRSTPETRIMYLLQRVPVTSTRNSDSDCRGQLRVDVALFQDDIQRSQSGSSVGIGELAWAGLVGRQKFKVAVVRKDTSRGEMWFKLFCLSQSLRISLSRTASK